MNESFSDVLQRKVRAMGDLEHLHEYAASLRPHDGSDIPMGSVEWECTPFSDALQLCEVCDIGGAAGVVFWDQNDVPIIHICADCLATGLEVALGVKMEGLMAQWRQAKTLKAARLAAKQAERSAPPKSRKVKDASEC